MRGSNELTNLLEGEKVVYKTGLHRWILIWPTSLILLFFVLIIVSAANNSVGGGIFCGLLFLIAVILAITARLDYSTAHLYLTNKRIILKAGWMRKVLEEVLLDKVQGIDIDQSIPGRILNYGAIRIKGIGINNINMKNVKEPFEFRMQAQEQIRNIQEEIKIVEGEK